MKGSSVLKMSSLRRLWRASVHCHRTFSASTAIMQAKKHTPSKDNEENGDPKAKPQESGKEKLLDLLGSMKVEVTSKRKLQSLKGQISKDQKRISVESLESATSMFQEAASENKDPKTVVSPELISAVSAVAKSMPDKNKVESELLQQLRKHESGNGIQAKQETANIVDIIADMKIGKQANNARFAARPANQIHFDDDGHGYIHEKEKNSDFTGVKRRFDLFQGKRLSIFQVPLEIKHPDKKEAPVLSLWDVELAKQIAAVVQHVPRNGFEEMIQWTREGKLWQYPIDNEAGLEEEAEVPFHEHVFLENHLEDFPKHGPIRHFMELVVNGLSKNHCLTVKQKTEHIQWFKDYFKQKEDILRENEVYLN
ncbi:28S ribosomal protein S31, mitochondrial [Polypterus senegalus]|uniref:28S ribosomal protein S31, mitochondrial n=1 Tax=Polypterus senegalus TaxID=55291 RepID=UPI0019624F9B|nr:28S ribosomal protein S31, mitochondrial [Polypterus senegalus]